MRIKIIDMVSSNTNIILLYENEKLVYQKCINYCYDYYKYIVVIHM